MKDTKNLLFSLSFLILLGGLITVSLTSCSFCHGEPACQYVGEDAPLKELTSHPNPYVVFKEQGTIIVFHGFGCKVPANCFSPDCSFRITVDSGNQVDESNNEGNNSVGGNCIG